MLESGCTVVSVRCERIIDPHTTEMLNGLENIRDMHSGKGSSFDSSTHYKRSRDSRSTMRHSMESEISRRTTAISSKVDIGVYGTLTVIMINDTCYSCYFRPEAKADAVKTKKIDSHSMDVDTQTGETDHEEYANQKFESIPVDYAFYADLDSAYVLQESNTIRFAGHFEDITYVYVRNPVEFSLFNKSLEECRDTTRVTLRIQSLTRDIYFAGLYRNQLPDAVGQPIALEDHAPSQQFMEKLYGSIENAGEVSQNKDSRRSIRNRSKASSSSAKNTSSSSVCSSPLSDHVKVACVFCGVDRKEDIKREYMVHPYVGRLFDGSTVYMCLPCVVNWSQYRNALDEESGLVLPGEINEELCALCSDTPSELVLCGKCVRSYCTPCLQRTCSAQEMAALQSDEDWHCMCCKSSTKRGKGIAHVITPKEDWRLVVSRDSKFSKPGQLYQYVQDLAMAQNRRYLAIASSTERAPANDKSDFSTFNTPQRKRKRGGGDGDSRGRVKISKDSKNKGPVAEARAALAALESSLLKGISPSSSSSKVRKDASHALQALKDSSFLQRDSSSSTHGNGVSQRMRKPSALLSSLDYEYADDEKERLKTALQASLDQVDAIPSVSTDLHETVIICDGCDAEYFCKDVGIKFIPKGDWFCKMCKKKAATVQTTPDSNLPPVDEKKSDSYYFAPYVMHVDDSIITNEIASSHLAARFQTDDVCFLCKDGGDLVECDNIRHPCVTRQSLKNDKKTIVSARCQKVYHPYCLAFAPPDDEGTEWCCPRHYCDGCGSRNLLYTCKYCPLGFCSNCFPVTTLIDRYVPLQKPKYGWEFSEKTKSMCCGRCLSSLEKCQKEGRKITGENEVHPVLSATHVNLRNTVLSNVRGNVRGGPITSLTMRRSSCRPAPVAMSIQMRAMIEKGQKKCAPPPSHVPACILSKADDTQSQDKQPSSGAGEEKPESVQEEPDVSPERPETVPMEVNSIPVDHSTLPTSEKDSKYSFSSDLKPDTDPSPDANSDQSSESASVPEQGVALTWADMKVDDSASKSKERKKLLAAATKAKEKKDCGGSRQKKTSEKLTVGDAASGDKSKKSLPSKPDKSPNAAKSKCSAKASDKEKSKTIPKSSGGVEKSKDKSKSKKISSACGEKDRFKEKSRSNEKGRDRSKDISKLRHNASSHMIQDVMSDANSYGNDNSTFSIPMPQPNAEPDDAEYQIYGTVI